MGVTKTDCYTERQNRLATIFKAIGHPARIAILEQLLREQCCICKDFSEEIDLAQPTISRHLRELKDAGLISGSIEGTRVSYCLSPEIRRELGVLLGDFFSTDCC